MQNLEENTIENKKPRGRPVGTEVIKSTISLEDLSKITLTKAQMKLIKKSNNPNPRVLTDEQKAAAIERLAAGRAKMLENKRIAKEEEEAVSNARKPLPEKKIVVNVKPRAKHKPKPAKKLSIKKEEVYTSSEDDAQSSSDDTDVIHRRVIKKITDKKKKLEEIQNEPMPLPQYQYRDQLAFWK